MENEGTSLIAGESIPYETYGRVMHVSDNADRTTLFSSENFTKADLVITDKGRVIKNRVHPEFVHSDLDGIWKAEDPVQEEPKPTFEPFDVLIGKIHQWGVDRNIIGGGTVQAQFPKLVEELSEAFIEPDHNWEAIKDGIGDAIVVLVQMAGIGGFRITKPLISVTHADIHMWSNESYLYEMVKTIGSLGTAVAKNNEKMLLALYDRLVYVLSIRAAVMDATLEECLTLAYNEIKDRKGVLYKGVFVKSDDTSYPSIMAELGKTID